MQFYFGAYSSWLVRVGLQDMEFDIMIKIETFVLLLTHNKRINIKSFFFFDFSIDLNYILSLVSRVSNKIVFIPVGDPTSIRNYDISLYISGCKPQPLSRFYRVELVDVGSPTHTPHAETANSCVRLYIMGGPIAAR